MKDNQFFKAANLYRKFGYTVIPAGAGQDRKKPYIQWTNFQHKAPSDAQIKQWWQQWPDANPALICGKCSGIMVIDCDTCDAIDSMSEFISNDFKIPTVTTPKGGRHYYFEDQPGLVNRARPLDGIDIRTDGGYALAPPETNCMGRYRWLKGLGLHEVAPPQMPRMLFDILSQACNASALSSAHINDRIHYNSVCGHPKAGDNIRQHLTTSDNITFNKGGRDQTLFHLANHLVKSGMPHANIERYLKFFGRNCSPPFPEKKIQAKIQSAFKRAQKQKRNLTQDIRDLF